MTSTIVAEAHPPIHVVPQLSFGRAGSISLAVVTSPKRVTQRPRVEPLPWAKG